MRVPTVNEDGSLKLYQCESCRGAHGGRGSGSGGGGCSLCAHGTGRRWYWTLEEQISADGEDVSMDEELQRWLSIDAMDRRTLAPSEDGARSEVNPYHKERGSRRAIPRNVQISPRRFISRSKSRSTSTPRVSGSPEGGRHTSRHYDDPHHLRDLPSLTPEPHSDLSNEEHYTSNLDDGFQPTFDDDFSAIHTVDSAVSPDSNGANSQRYVTLRRGHKRSFSQVSLSEGAAQGTKKVPPSEEDIQHGRLRDVARRFRELARLIDVDISQKEAHPSVVFWP